MSDPYEPHGFKANSSLTNKILPFPNQPTMHSRPEQARNFFHFPSVAQRAKNNARAPSARPSHPQHRIFSLSNNFTTPQRHRVKLEPTSRKPFFKFLAFIYSSIVSATESHDYSPTRVHISQSSLQQRFDEPVHAVESHQFRFMPTPVPQSDQRSSSRAPSETPPAPAIDADSEDLNLSEMMNRRMKEAKLVKVQLAEEVNITLCSCMRWN